MVRVAVPTWREALVLSREIMTPGERAAFFGAVQRGEFVRLFRGVYVSEQRWEACSGDGRHLMRIAAASVYSGDELVFTHLSAAALWRLPIVGQWPNRVHVLREPGRAGSNAMFVRHLDDRPDSTHVLNGRAVSSIGRTVVDVARIASFETAVAIADAALRRTTHPIADMPVTALSIDDLSRELILLGSGSGSARARRVVQFADGAADRPGESVSRVSMHVAGVTAPILQARLFGASGRVYFVDFWWPELGMIGEFDGAAKYTDPDFLRGRTPEQALTDEKAREDDLRAAGYGMTRWGWKLARNPAALRAHLARAGIR